MSQSLTLAEVGPQQTITSIIMVSGYGESFALRKTHRDITGLSPQPQIGWFWNGSVFLASPPAPNLVAIAARSAAQLRTACASTIVAGFTSSALGTVHTYPSTMVDQRNLSDAATAAATAASGWTADIWCEAGATWAFTSHTAAQVQQVMTDWIAFRTAQQQTLVTLLATVASATTLAAIQAVVWP